MPKKISIKKAAQRFRARADGITGFLLTVGQGQSKEHVSWLYDYAIIRMYREFEQLMLDSIVGAINNDTSTLADTTGFSFPKHLTTQVCVYLILGKGYFDFKGRDDLVQTLKKYVPEDHYLVTIIKKEKYKAPLERLSALRNYAAHGSDASKRTALATVGQKKISSCGSWLKCQDRFERIKDGLNSLAFEIESAAPY